MLRFLFRVAAVLLLLLSLMVAATLATPQEDATLAAFLTAPENCAGSCLLGIHPGRTTVSEVLDHLRSHPWVDVEHVVLDAPGTGYGQIAWDWSGRQPQAIDSTREGRLTFYWDTHDDIDDALSDARIETVVLYTRMQMIGLQDWFGTPDSGTVNHRYSDDLTYSAAYHRSTGMVDLSTRIPCPATFMDYWQAQARFTLSIGHGTSSFVAPFEMLKMC